MPKYDVLTSSGATYTVDTERRWWTHASKDSWIDTSEPLRAFKVFDLDDLMGKTNSEAWEYVRDLPPAEAPEVGKVMYLHGSISDGTWRRSMPVVSFEVSPSPEEDDEDEYEGQ